jgi:hypothetical protein
VKGSQTPTRWTYEKKTFEPVQKVEKILSGGTSGPRTENRSLSARRTKGFSLFEGNLKIKPFLSDLDIRFGTLIGSESSFFGRRERSKRVTDDRQVID